MVQRNAQGISPLRQYLCHHAERISSLSNLFKTTDGLLSKLINGVGNARIELFTDIRIPSNNSGKKERNVKY